MTPYGPPAPSAPVRPAGAAVAVIAASVGLVALGAGMSLRFHISNTSEALAEQTRGGLLLLTAAVLLLGAGGLARWARVPWWPVLLIPAPVVSAAIPALVLPGNILPFGTALLGGLLTVTGLIATIVYAATRWR
ncbi:hypothetical protein [Actinoplanes auranticolor]|uniref:Uncharacterized protein n=1 Tax=Actinoplanes auranticolor TaxID=47988 RepID=A0A919VQS2_9ACTN|nr:hypothetical protein [Actinoplanes auranticolor]GIM72115.1 hypothetical protein Aau02nite_49280 [Actinoplanes auranticolor]